MLKSKNNEKRENEKNVAYICGHLTYHMRGSVEVWAKLVRGT